MLESARVILRVTKVFPRLGDSQLIKCHCKHTFSMIRGNLRSSSKHDFPQWRKESADKKGFSLFVVFLELGQKVRTSKLDKTVSSAPCQRYKKTGLRNLRSPAKHPIEMRCVLVIHIIHTRISNCLFRQISDHGFGRDH